jgi:membrane peptidoglycan carboxypeptidase
MPRTLGRIDERSAGWRRPALFAAGLAALLGLFLAVSWTVTPSTTDLLARVRTIDRVHHAPTLAPDQVPRTLAEALVATEDQNFYHDNGVDVGALARAALYDLVHRCACQGGSTLTQQLAEDVYLNGTDRTPWRRWEDIVLALKISAHLSRAQILAAYASEVYLGNGAYGAAAASEVYFHRPLRDITLAQAAMLAGLPQAPSLYDPLVHPALARARRAEVLALMVSQGYIGAEQAQVASRASVTG